MRLMLLGLAASTAAISVPASADRFDGPAFSAAATGSPVRIHIGNGPGAGGGDVRRHRDGRDGDHRRRPHRRDDPELVIGWGFDRSSDWDGNRSFDPDRWNDWWHERPSRSYPRWVQNRDGNCERMWWSGSGWRCSW